MQILLTSATYTELGPLLSHFPAPYAPGRYRTGNLEIDLLLTGAGINHMDYFLATRLAEKNYALAVLGGICGAFQREIKLGETVQVVSEQFADLGAQDHKNFLSIFDMGLLEENAWPFSAGKLIPPAYGNLKTLQGLRKVHGITVNTVHGEAVSIAKSQAQFPANVESMEGAGFFFCCMMHRLPCIEIRTVSNYVEPRNTADWNIPLATENLGNVLSELCKELAA